MICDECETVAHCTKNGCVPKHQALKPLKDEQREKIAKEWRGRNWTMGDIIDAVEAAHGITKDQP
jgi:hypothetical protein